jgi:hypothetical protein
MSSTRRARPKVSLTATGDLYLLHFHRRLGTGKHSIQHYLGFTPDLDARLDKHRRGQGARITQVLKERGIVWDVVAVWPDNRQIENALKLHSATQICTVCTPSPRIPLIVQQVIGAEQERRAREAERLAARDPGPVRAGPRPGRTSRRLAGPGSAGDAWRPWRPCPPALCPSSCTAGPGSWEPARRIRPATAAAILAVSPHAVTSARRRS